MSYSIFRVAKVKNSTTTRALQRHNQRENKTYSNKDIDHDKTHLNYDLINPEEVQYTDKINQVIEEGYQGKRKIRSDAIKHVDGIITSDNEFFQNLSPEEQKDYFKDSLDFVKQEYGKANILYATVHLDEKTPHMHFGFVPLTEDGRLSAKDVLGNKKAMSDLQDRFHDFVTEKGYNLERGEKRDNVKHIEMQKFKEQTLYENISKLESKEKELNNKIQQVNEIASKIEVVDDIDQKAKNMGLGKFVSNKDWETVKDMAKSSAVMIEDMQSLKENYADAMKEQTERNKELESEVKYYQILNSKAPKIETENKKLKRENKELKQEKNALERELQRYKDFVKIFGEQVKIRMEKMAKKLEVKGLFEAFEKYVFEPSKNFANAEYGKDRREEKKELKKEKEQEMDLEQE